MTFVKHALSALSVGAMLWGCDSSAPVLPAPEGRVASVVIVPASTFLQPGQSRQLALEVRDSLGLAVSRFSSVWASDNASVATVSASGMLTAVNTGSARISVRIEQLEVSITVGVTTLTAGALQWDVVREGGDAASLLALWDDGAGTAWAGGSAGILLRSVGGGDWERVPLETKEIIVSIWGATPTDIWLVGSGGLLMRGNGTSWEKLPPIMPRTLLCVWGLSKNEVYATGDNGFIARWDGSLWSVMGSPTINELWSIGGTSSSDLWAVGNNGTILRNRGPRWEMMDSPSPALFLGVWSASPNDAFIVGTQGVALRWNGNDWNRLTTPAEVNLFGLWGRSVNEVYAAGNNGAFWRYNGSAWESMGIGSGQNLRAVAPSSVTAGGVRVAGWYNAILSYRPAATSKVELLDAVLLSAWRATAGGADHPVYAVGLGGAVGQRTSSGFSWLNVPPVNDLYSISGSGPDDIVAVGDTSSILRYNGTSWRSEGERTPGLLRSVWSIGRNQHVIVGEGGRILRSSGEGWVPQQSGTQRFLRAVWGLDDDRLFAVGDTGLLLRYDGQRWRSETTPTSVILRAVWGTSADDVFVAGDGGVLLRWDGQRAVAMPSPTTRDLRGLWGRSPTEVYAVGDSGTVLRYDGVQWSTIDAGTQVYLFSITGSAAGGPVTAVGDRATVIDGRQ